MPTNFGSNTPLTFKDPSANLFKSPVDDYIAKPKASTPKASSTKGASVVTNTQPTQTPLPDDTKLYQDLNVTTWVGGYGEGQTVDTIQKWMQVRAYRPELIKELQDTKQYGDAVLNSPNAFPAKTAKEEDKSLFTSTEWLNLESTVGQIKLAKAKALWDVQDFLFNPESKIASTFKKNIWVDKYNNYKAIVDNFDVMKEAIKSDTSFVDEERGIRGIRTLAPIKAAIDIMSPTWKDYSTYLAAIGAAKEDGAKPIEDWTTPTANFLWGALMYGWASSVGRSVLTKGLSEMGFAIEGTTWGNMVKLANTIERTANKSPTLYAATVDNALTNAMEYGVTKSLNGDYSSSDFINNMLIGATVPFIFKGVGVAYDKVKWMVKGVTPKDVVGIEKAVKTHMQEQGSTTVKEAMDWIADSHVFSDGETLATKLDNYKAETPKNPDSVISHPEVQSTFAAQGKSISTRAAKKVANVITKLNEKIKGENTAEGWYGALGDEDKIQITKKAVMDNLAGETVVNWDVADKAIKKAFEDNGMKYNEGEYGIIHSSLDDVDEMFHTPTSKPEDIPHAKSLTDLENAVKWESEKNVSQSHIDDINTKLDRWDESVIGDIGKAAESTWVKFDPERAYKKWVIGEASRTLDNTYLAGVNKQIELARFGYKNARNNAIKAFTERVNNIKENLRNSFGKQFEDLIGKPLGKTMLSDIESIVKWALHTTKVWGKLVSNRLNKVADNTWKVLSDVGRQWVKLARDIESSLTNTTRQIKRDIDTIAEWFPVLGKSYRKVIRDKYKAKITPSTTFDGVQKILTDMHKELYIKTAKELESNADTLIQRVMKMNNTKSKKSNLNVETIEKLIETYSRFNKAKLEGNLVDMVAANQDLENFYKQGRDIFKQNVTEVKASIKSDVTQFVAQLDREGTKRAEMRFINTPVSGIGRAKTFLEWVRAYAESVIPANLQIFHIFKGNKIMQKVFLGNFQKAQTIFANVKREIVDIAAPKAIKLAQKVGWSHDDASYKLSLWMGKDGEYAHENNLLTDITFQKNKNGEYEVVFSDNYETFLLDNQKLVDSGDIIHFGTSQNTELKEKILNSIYSKLDSHYSSNKEFKNVVDQIRTHLSQTGDDIAEVSKRRFNKIFVKMENYFPMIKKGKGWVESAFDSSGEFSTFVKDSIEDGHMNTRVPPAQGQMVRRELWFTETLNHHLDWAVWWKMNIENLLDADATLRKMKQWRNGLRDEVPLTPIDDMYDMAKLAEDTPDIDGIDNPIMTDEVSFFLRTHIGKIATRGRNLSSGTDFGRRVVNGFSAQANRIMLSWPYTALKQTASLPDIAIQAGNDNFLTWMRSASNGNINIALQDSGYLMERQATVTSKEGAWRNSFIQSNKTLAQKAWGMWNNAMDMLTGNTTKLVDGALSSRAWLSWMSKYLDENNLFHKSWDKLDLASVRDKILKLENGREIWMDAVTEADSMMSKVMGSNQLVDKAIGSESLLTKGTLLFQRTGLNHLVSTIDSVAGKYRDGRLWGAGKTKATALASLQASKVALGSAFVYADFKAIEYLKNQVAIGMGSKDEESTKKIYDSFGNEVVNPTYDDIVWNEMKFWFFSNMISPNMGIDLTTGFSPAINQFKKVAKAPTNERRTEELFHTVAKASMNGSWEDILRYGMSTMGIGMTSSTAKKYDSAFLTAKKTVGWVPTDEQVTKQTEINSIQLSNSKTSKELVTKKSSFIKNAIAKYWSDITQEEYVKFVNENKKDFDALEIYTPAQAKSFFASLQLTGKKSSWEVDSVLMGKDIETIFDVQIVPLLKEWKRDEAWKEVLRLDSKWVIKAGAGRKKILEMFQSYKAQ